jgi:hypothetical protein
VRACVISIFCQLLICRLMLEDAVEAWTLLSTVCKFRFVSGFAGVTSMQCVPIIEVSPLSVAYKSSIILGRQRCIFNINTTS